MKVECACGRLIANRNFRPHGRKCTRQLLEWARSGHNIFILDERPVSEKDCYPLVYRDHDGFQCICPQPLEKSWWAGYIRSPRCEIGLQVRSKRRHSNIVGTIIAHDPSLVTPGTGRPYPRPYPWLVRWPGGEEEWCREGELRYIETMRENIYV